MAKRVYWNIVVLDGLTEVFSTRVARGDVSRDDLREMMRRLAIYFARLTPAEIVSASRNRQNLIATSERELTVTLANITVMSREAERSEPVR